MPFYYFLAYFFPFSHESYKPHCTISGAVAGRTYLSQVVQVGLVPDQIGRGRVLQLPELAERPLGVLVAGPVRDAVHDKARVGPLDLLHREIILVLGRNVHDLHVQHPTVQGYRLFVEQVGVRAVLADEPSRQIPHGQGCVCVPRIIKTNGRRKIRSHISTHFLLEGWGRRTDGQALGNSFRKGGNITHFMTIISRKDYPCHCQ